MSHARLLPFEEWRLVGGVAQKSALELIEEKYQPLPDISRVEDQAYAPIETHVFPPHFHPTGPRITWNAQLQAFMSRMHQAGKEEGQPTLMHIAKMDRNPIFRHF